jgi:hypothetical protein
VDFAGVDYSEPEQGQETEIVDGDKAETEVIDPNDIAEFINEAVIPREDNDAPIIIDDQPIPNNDDNVLNPDEETVASDDSNIDEDADVPDEPQDDDGPWQQVTRSGRVSKPPSRLNLYHNIAMTQPETYEYSDEMSQIIAKTIHHMNYKSKQPKPRSYAMAVTYSLNKGLHKFGEKGYNAAFN